MVRLTFSLALGLYLAACTIYFHRISLTWHFAHITISVTRIVTCSPATLIPRSADMFKCIGCGLAILALLLGVLSPAEACGRWRCRHRSCTVCPPPSIVCRSPDEQAVQVYGGPEYVLDLATSIAKAA